MLASLAPHNQPDLRRSRSLVERNHTLLPSSGAALGPFAVIQHQP
jgi:hypothetical protein